MVRVVESFRTEVKGFYHDGVVPAARMVKKAGQYAVELWKQRPIGPILLMMPPVTPRNLKSRIVNGAEFKPVGLAHLQHLQESMAPVLGRFGLRLEEVQEHEFRPAIRPTGEIFDMNGVVAPKILAQNLVATVTVKTNGAGTGTERDFKKVKTTVDGAGAISTYNGTQAAAEELLEYGYSTATIGVEGTPTHAKPGESAIGNPTIPIGELFLRVALKKIKVIVNSAIEIFEFTRGIFLLFDVVEGTEMAATTLEAYQKISGRPGAKDNGPVSLVAAYDTPHIIADTYAMKCIVSPEIAEALQKAGIELSLDDSYEVILSKIAQATNRPISDFSVMSLGLKPRIKYVDGVAQPVKEDRAAKRVMFEELKRLGITKIITFDDGESPAMGVMYRGEEILFEDGQKGKVDIIWGPGGVVEGVTAARTIADICKTGTQKYAARWRYVSKEMTRNRETYFMMHLIPESKMAEYEKRGILSQFQRVSLGENKGFAYVIPDQSISDFIPDNGDRIFVQATLDYNPRLNPYAIPPEIDEKEGTFVVYQEVVSSDGKVVGRYFTLRAKVGYNDVAARIYPLLADLMRSKTSTELQQRLQAVRENEASMAALKGSLRMYLYSLVGETYSHDRPPFYLEMRQLILRRLSDDVEDQKAIALLRFLVDEHPEWFSNPQAIQDSQRIVDENLYKVEERDEDGHAIAVEILEAPEET